MCTAQLPSCRWWLTSQMHVTSVGMDKLALDGCHVVYGNVMSFTFRSRNYEAKRGIADTDFVVYYRKGFSQID